MIKKKPHTLGSLTIHEHPIAFWHPWPVKVNSWIMFFFSNPICKKVKIGINIRLLLRSSETQRIYIGTCTCNTHSDFLVHLPKLLSMHLQEHWTVSLLKFNLSTASIQKESYIYSIPCHDSLGRKKITSIATSVLLI